VTTIEVTAAPAAAHPVERLRVVTTSAPPWEWRFLVAVVAADLLAAVSTSFAAMSVRSVTLINVVGTHGRVGVVTTAAVLWFLACGAAKAYDRRVLGAGSEEFRRLLRATVWLTAALGFASYAWRVQLPRGFVVVLIPTLLMFSAVGRYAARKRLHHLRRRGECARRTLVVGPRAQVSDLVRDLARESHHGMRVVGACLTSAVSPEDRMGDLPVLGGFDDVVEIIDRVGVDVVAVAAGPGSVGNPLRKLSWALEGTGVRLVVAPGLVEVAGPRLHITPVAGLPLLLVEEPCFSGARRIVKGLVDRSVALASLVLLAPALVAIAIAIWLTSDGPVVFRQTRIGRHGRPFTLFKFRTMFDGADLQQASLSALNERSDGLLFKIKRDPRVTPLGRWLRRYSLDELPQLLNVVSGRMSLVGPRPPLPGEVERYAADVRRRLLVKPGLTGLWQISGRSDLDWEEAVRLDLRYVENWSLALDLMIIWKTLFVVVRGAGAY
jgi:exopolysaccharide biosynthesis polyprenyl glycosylphosphotransferase